MKNTRKEKRAKLNLTQAALAYKVNVSRQQTINSIEIGKNVIRNIQMYDTEGF